MASTKLSNAFVISFILISNCLAMQNPLHRAISFGDIEEIDRILESSPFLIDQVDRHGKTPLLCATFNAILMPEKNIRIVKHLITKHKANLNIPNLSGYTPLFLLQAYNARPELSEFFIENGAIIDVKSDIETTPLMMASFQRTPANTKVLLSRRSPTRSFDSFENSALIEATALDRLETLEALIDAGADINITDENGNNALIIAIKCGSFNCVKLLIEKGIKISHHNNNNDDALSIAIKFKQFEIAKFLHKIMKF